MQSAWEGGDVTLNSDTAWPSLDEARVCVLHYQRKLHRWAKDDSEKRFDDLFNLVYDRATLVVAWNKVRRNKGARTAGVDAVTRYYIERQKGTIPFLEDLRSSLKDRTYRPLPVREHGIPKAGGKVRYLGIPTIRDRVAQMALKLVLEPIFETDFYPSSYGYRPVRRAQDAIAEIAFLLSPRPAYNYVVEGDIRGCFDNVNHTILMRELRRRITDRRVLTVIKAFLRAGMIQETGRFAATLTGVPQGGILSPVLTNVYLTILDRYFERIWKHQTRYIGCSTYYRRQGHATYRLIRYADDFVILVRGNREQAKAVRDEAARVLNDELRMELALEKTFVTHVDEGFDFLGHHIKRVPWKGNLVAWTYPSRKSVNAIRRKVKRLTSRSTTSLSLKALLYQLNPVLRGWSTYFRYDASKQTLSYVDNYTWWRVVRWLHKKHPRRTWKYIRRRYCGGRWDIQEDGISLFRPSKVKVERYRFRGKRIFLPWMESDELGSIGPYAAARYDDLAVLSLLEDRLSNV